MIFKDWIIIKINVSSKMEKVGTRSCSEFPNLTFLNDIAYYYFGTIEVVIIRDIPKCCISTI